MEKLQKFSNSRENLTCTSQKYANQTRKLSILSARCRYDAGQPAEHCVSQGKIEPPYDDQEILYIMYELIFMCKMIISDFIMNRLCEINK